MNDYAHQNKDLSIVEKEHYHQHQCDYAENQYSRQEEEEDHNKELFVHF